MRFYSYDRTSDWDEQKISNDAQWIRCKEKSQMDYEQVPLRFSDEGCSGNDSSRPAFDRLKKFIESSDEEGTVFIWRYDRIARNATVALEFMNLCHKHNMTVRSVSEPLPEGTSSIALQKIFTQALFILGEAQRSIIIENIRSGLRYKKDHGKYLGATVPYGYGLIEGEVVQNYKEAKVVKRIFGLYGTEKYGYKNIAKILNEKGYCFKGHPFKVHNVSCILSNPLYYGKVKGGTFGPYMGNFKPIINESTFEKVQEIRKNRQVGKLDQRMYLLRQKLVCPYCGRKLSPKLVRNATGKIHHYYYCSNHSCKGIFINAKEAETAVMNAVFDFFQDKNVYSQLVAEVRQVLGTLTEKEKDKQKLTKKSQLEIMNDFENGLISSSQMKVELLALNQAEKSFQTKSTIEHYEQKLQHLLQLRSQDVQMILVNEVERVELTRSKKIQAIYLTGIKENILRKAS